MIAGIESEWLYCGLVGLVAVQRLVELVVARRHERIARSRGGVESGRGHYPLMVAVHAGLLVAAPVEVIALERPLVPALALTMLALLALAGVLRVWVIRTLSWRWTTRVITVPGLPPVTGGPFRWLAHPNYLAVCLEFLALPLVHGAWLTALVFSVLNGLVLRTRIRVESAALARAAAQPSAAGTVGIADDRS